MIHKRETNYSDKESNYLCLKQLCPTDQTMFLESYVRAITTVIIIYMKPGIEVSNSAEISCSSDYENHFLM